MLIVPKLNPNTPTLMDGEVRLFKRKHSKVWQIAFTLDGRQVRVSSKKRILNDAVAAAREIYLDYRFRQKNGLPVISKRFADVAALCRATMKQQLDNGVGKKSFRDYTASTTCFGIKADPEANKWMLFPMPGVSDRIFSISIWEIIRPAFSVPQ